MPSAWEQDDDPSVWGPFGNRTAWEEEYKKVHGYYPGEGPESYEEAVRNLLWSQSWQREHCTQPITEEVWKGHYYRPTDFKDTGQYEQRATSILEKYRTGAGQRLINPTAPLPMPQPYLPLPLKPGPSGITPPAQPRVEPPPGLGLAGPLTPPVIPEPLRPQSPTTTPPSGLGLYGPQPEPPSQYLPMITGAARPYLPTITKPQPPVPPGFDLGIRYGRPQPPQPPPWFGGVQPGPASQQGGPTRLDLYRIEENRLTPPTPAPWYRGKLPEDVPWPPPGTRMEAGVNDARLQAYGQSTQPQQAPLAGVPEWLRPGGLLKPDVTRRLGQSYLLGAGTVLGGAATGAQAAGNIQTPRPLQGIVGPTLGTRIGQAVEVVSGALNTELGQKILSGLASTVYIPETPLTVVNLGIALANKGLLDVDNPAQLGKLANLSRIGYTMQAKPERLEQTWAKVLAAGRREEMDAVLKEAEDSTVEMIGRGVVDLGWLNVGNILRGVPVLGKVFTPAAKATAVGEIARINQATAKLTREVDQAVTAAETTTKMPFLRAL